MIRNCFFSQHSIWPFDIDLKYMKKNISISVPNMSTKELTKKQLEATSDLQVENCYFQNLPNEILLKIVDYLQIGDLLRCGQTCRKIRSVVYDKSLWKKVNFSSNSKVPAGLLQLVLDHGCEFLNISNKLFGHLPLNQKSK